MSAYWVSGTVRGKVRARMCFGRKNVERAIARLFAEGAIGVSSVLITAAK